MAAQNNETASDGVAQQQLEQAAKDLHALAKTDYSLETVQAVLQETAHRAVPLGIHRIKWLKILTLWRLYPKDLPDHNALARILRDTSRSQDDRMNEAVALAAAGVSKP